MHMYSNVPTIKGSQSHQWKWPWCELPKDYKKNKRFQVIIFVDGMLITTLKVHLK